MQALGLIFSITKRKNSINSWSENVIPAFEVEAGGSGIQGYPQLHEFTGSLGYMKFLKIIKQTLIIRKIFLFLENISKKYLVMKSHKSPKH